MKISPKDEQDVSSIIGGIDMRDILESHLVLLNGLIGKYRVKPSGTEEADLEIVTKAYSPCSVLLLLPNFGSWILHRTYKAKGRAPSRGLNIDNGSNVFGASYTHIESQPFH